MSDGIQYDADDVSSTARSLSRELGQIIAKCDAVIDDAKRYLSEDRTILRCVSCKCALSPREERYSVCKRCYSEALSVPR